MDTTSEVIRAAEARAQALASGDADRLRELLHSDFRWVSHAGERYDRESYVASNVESTNGWSEQRLTDISVVAHEQTAVLRCTVVDTIDGGHGPREYRMPMTQVWIRREGRWVCLAGHAGARL
jgi:ketosteroid isomerase-like protein